MELFKELEITMHTALLVQSLTLNGFSLNGIGHNKAYDLIQILQEAMDVHFFQ